MERLFVELKDDLIAMKAYAEAWDAVARNRKKDGGDFQSYKRNFSGLKIEEDTLDGVPLYAVVYTSYDTTGGGYHHVSDYMDIRTTTEPENYASKHKPYTWTEPFYVLAPADVMKKAAERADYWRAEAEKLEAALGSVAAVVEELKRLEAEAQSKIDSLGSGTARSKVRQLYRKGI